MKSIITIVVLLATTTLPLPALASEDAFNSMYKAKYIQLMTMPRIKKIAECLGGWEVIRSDSGNGLFKHAAWHSEKFTNMTIKDKSISAVEVAHRMRAMQDFSRYFPDGVNDSAIARIRQDKHFFILMIEQCSINSETGKIRETPHE